MKRGRAEEEKKKRKGKRKNERKREGEETKRSINIEGRNRTCPEETM